MPIWRIYESIDPAAEPFDVIIVDESSQADLKGVPIWWAGKRVIVVGDEEQVIPLAVAQNVDQIQLLQRQHLAGYRSPQVWDGKFSLFAIAGNHFGRCHVTLTEHFRCHPDIIAFSDYLCYTPKGSPLKPLRSADRAPFAQALVEVRVTPRGEGDINEAEVDQVIALVDSIRSNPAYRGMSLGIMSLKGGEQADRIDRELRVRLNLDGDDIESLKGGGRGSRRLCGIPPDFQGDERDIIILSMVDRPREDGGPHMLKTQPMFVQRYNVAVSRARHQLWLVHSFNASTDLKPEDLRRRLIDHVRDPSVIRRRLESVSAQTQSPFELEVATALVTAGYVVKPQHPVGGYSIDMMVHGDRSQLAVECDGERRHGPEKTMEDIERQRLLERLGYTFHTGQPRRKHDGCETRGACRGSTATAGDQTQRDRTKQGKSLEPLTGLSHRQEHMLKVRGHPLVVGCSQIYPFRLRAYVYTPSIRRAADMPLTHRTRTPRARRNAKATEARTQRVSREARLMKSGNGQYVGITKDLLRQAGATPDMRYRIDVVGPREVLVHFIDSPEVRRLTLDEVLAHAKRKKIAARDITDDDRVHGRELL